MGGGGCENVYEDHNKCEYHIRELANECMPNSPKIWASIFKLGWAKISPVRKCPQQGSLSI